MEKPKLPSAHKDQDDSPPTLKQLFIADEQPGEADQATIEYLRAHPEIQRIIDRQKAFDRKAKEWARGHRPENGSLLDSDSGTK